MSRLGSHVASIGMWAYAALIFALCIPSVVSQSLLWQFSLAIFVIVAVPTAVIGGLLLLPVFRRAIGVLALAWMVFVTFGWVSSNSVLVVVSAAVTVAVVWSVIERFRAAAVEREGGVSAKT